MNQSNAINRALFSGAPDNERPDEAASPDVSDAAMRSMRSPFETASPAGSGPDGGREHQAD